MRSVAARSGGRFAGGCERAGNHVSTPPIVSDLLPRNRCLDPPMGAQERSKLLSCDIERLGSSRAEQGTASQFLGRSHGGAPLPLCAVEEHIVDRNTHSVIITDETGGQRTDMPRCSSLVPAPVGGWRRWMATAEQTSELVGGLLEATEWVVARVL